MGFRVTGRPCARAGTRHPRTECDCHIAFTGMSVPEPPTLDMVDSTTMLTKTCTDRIAQVLIGIEYTYIRFTGPYSDRTCLMLSAIVHSAVRHAPSLCKRGRQQHT